MERNSGWKSEKKKRMNIIVGSESEPTQFSGGEVIINKKATKKNLERLVELNADGTGKTTTDASDGGLLKGKSHDDGGIPGVVGGVRQIETEGEEFVVSKEASEKHWKELSKINQSTGGVAINNPGGFDDDPEYGEGGKIDFNPNKLPKKNILKYAEMVRTKYPKVWDLGGNIFGNQAYKNLKRVSERGYWTDSEEWMFIKWRAYVARHQKDFRIEGVIAMLKWVDTVDKGWAYMRQLIDQEIKKRYPKKMKGGGLIPPMGTLTTKDKKTKLDYKKVGNDFEFVVYDDKPNPINKVLMNYTEFVNYLYNEGYIDEKMKDGGRTVSQTPAPKKDRISGSKVNKPKSSESSKSASSIKFSEETLTTIRNKVKEHNAKNPSKKVTLAVAKAVVRRGMGAYSSSHRPTISGGKPNDRTAWGLARLNAFLYKVEHGKSKSGKYSQDNDLIEELGYKVAKYHLGGDMSKHLAPNGKPSNLTHEQWHLVRTPEFKAWFGDWENDPANASKVVDSNGEPMVVYHGTGSNFNIFKIGKTRGLFFSNNKESAKRFSEGDLRREGDSPRVIECFLKANKLYEKNTKDEVLVDAYYQNFFQLRPFISKGSQKNILKDKYHKFFMDLVSFGIVNEEPKDYIISNSYDGIIIDSDNNSKSYIVFEPTQIKLADGSNTTFDSNNPDIRFEKGGNVEYQSRDLNGTMVYYKRDPGSKWEFISKSEFDQNANEMNTVKFDEGGSFEFVPEKKGTLIRGNEIIKYFEKVNGNYRLLFYTLNESKGKVPTMCDAFDHCYHLDTNDVKPSELVELIKKNKLMKDGGSVDAKDTVTVDIPLMIRLLELSREDVKSDAELHMVVERLLNLKNKPVLTMDDYAYIAEVEHKHLKQKMDLGGNLEIERLISQAHTNLTTKRGRRDYAPTTAEIQEEIDRMSMEQQFGSNNI